MRSLTVDECSVVSGGLLQKPFGDIGAFDDGSSFGSILGPLAFLLEKQGGSGGDDGGSGVFVTTDANGVETVWIFSGSAVAPSATAAAVCQVNHAAAGGVVGLAIGHYGGAWIGSVVGGAAGFVAIPVVGPVGPIAGAAAGYIVGKHAGGAFGFWAGGVVGGYSGAYSCNGG